MALDRLIEDALFCLVGVCYDSILATVSCSVLKSLYSWFPSTRKPAMPLCHLPIDLFSCMSHPAVLRSSPSAVRICLAIGYAMRKIGIVFVTLLINNAPDESWLTHRRPQNIHLSPLINNFIPRTFNWSLAANIKGICDDSLGLMPFTCSSLKNWRARITERLKAEAGWSIDRQDRRGRLVWSLCLRSNRIQSFYVVGRACLIDCRHGGVSTPKKPKKNRKE